MRLNIGAKIKPFFADTFLLTIVNELKTILTVNPQQCPSSQ
jgi:hypothetical protein